MPAILDSPTIDLAFCLMILSSCSSYYSSPLGAECLDAETYFETQGYLGTEKGICRATRMPLCWET